MTKNEKIIKMFNSKKWNRGSKIFNSSDFKKFGLSVSDANLAKQIISDMGFKTDIGMGLFVEQTVTMKDLQEIDKARGE